jgi:dextranase
MKVIEIYPDKGTYIPEEEVKVFLSIETDQLQVVPFLIEVYHLNEKVQSFHQEVALKAGKQNVLFPIMVPSKAQRGYRVEVSWQDSEGESAHAYTAFDVLDDWTQYPRYGFLTDFHGGAPNSGDRIRTLLKYHINGVQFYDWQYRHDQLMPPAKEFIDPLGRKMSLEVIEGLISACHQAGIKAMPYLAVYAASLEFTERHPAWRLYDEAKTPITFEGFLGIMDPTPGSPWIEHLVQQCQTVLEETNFDGLHVDQYGDPKTGRNINGEIVDIPDAFHQFVFRLKNDFPKAALTFNAVGNWPIEALATAPQDFVYIEVWEPTPSYQDLQDIVLNARRLSNGKPVVIAQYLQNTQIANIRLSDAIFYACGGSRIEIGEVERLLADPYYPKHQEISAELGSILKQYIDFAVSYSELIGPMAENIDLEEVASPGELMLIARKSQGWISLNMINFSGLGNPHWIDDHAEPQSMKEAWIDVPASRTVKEVFWATPDKQDQALQKCEWNFFGGRLHIKAPFVDYWTMIAIQLSEGGDD